MLAEFNLGGASSVAHISIYIAYPMEVSSTDRDVSISGGDVQQGDVFVDGTPETCNDYSIEGNWCSQKMSVALVHNVACNVDADYKVTGIRVRCALGASKDECDLTGLDQAKDTGLEAQFTLTTGSNLCDAGSVTYHEDPLNITEFALLKGSELALIDQASY